MFNIKNFNEKLALKITTIVGTMWCFYGFATLCILPTLFPAWQNQILFVSNCFQLVLLPLIMVGQSIMNRASEKRAEEDHQTLMNEFQELKDIHADIKKLAERD